MKNHTLPELVQRAPRPAPWREQPPNPNPSTPSADRRRHLIHADTNLDPLAHRQRLVALIGARYNTNNRTHLAGAHFTAAQELRNRNLANQLPDTEHLPQQRYYLPEQMAAHHATAHKLPPDFADQIAALHHVTADRDTYLATLTRYEHHELAARIALTLGQIDRELAELDLITTPGRARNRATQCAENIAARLRALNAQANYDKHTDQNKKRERRTHERRKEKERRAGTKPYHSDDLQGWYPLIIAKPPREIAHLGRLGRRRIATNGGKNPSRIANYCGDPERRIFTRTSRGTNALVLVDCSGSMSLTPDDLAAIMAASAGATVWGYSASRHDETNLYLLAHNSRRVREMPHWSGGNGIDAPAAAYTHQHYRKTGAPMIWITDGNATGLGDRTGYNLRQQCRTLAAKIGATIAPDVPTALADLAAIQRGTRPPQRLQTFR